MARITTIGACVALALAGGSVDTGLAIPPVHCCHVTCVRGVTNDFCDLTRLVCDSTFCAMRCGGLNGGECDTVGSSFCPDFRDALSCTGAGCQAVCNTPTSTPTNTPTNTPTATPTNTPIPIGGACSTPSLCSTGF